MLRKPFKPTEIVVRNVTRYCFGQMDDGSFVVWALGEAGWFEIHPARHYKAIHDEVMEAVEILYFVTDIYNEPRKKGGGPSPALIYREVSAATLEQASASVPCDCMLTPRSTPKTKGPHALK